MDPLIQVIVSSLTVIAAAVIAVVVGGRKGLADVEARGDAEMTRLVTALEARVRLMTEEATTAAAQVIFLKAEVAALRVEVAALKAELQVEQRITARLTKESGEK